jgi:tetratricopeptide (TPR) repeat protein
MLVRTLNYAVCRSEVCLGQQAGGISGVLGMKRESLLRWRFLGTASVLAALVLTIGARSFAEDAPPPPDPQREARLKLILGLEALRDKKQFVEALTGCEAFLREHGGTQEANRVLMLVSNIAWKDLKDDDRVLEFARRAQQEFAGVPSYFAWGLGYEAGRLLQAKKPEEAEKLLRIGMQKLGAPLPNDQYGTKCWMTLAQSLQQQQKLDEALEAALQAGRSSAGLLSQAQFVRLLYTLYSRQGNWDGALSAAKLGFVMCDMEQAEVDEAVQRVVRAFARKGDLNGGPRFLAAQNDLEALNPLKDVPLPDFNAEQLLASAPENNRKLRLNALLYAGKFDEALTVAKDMVIKSPTTDMMLEGIRSLARCFKAKDLSIVRANQFLEYHKTGKGEDPLATF